MAIGRCPGQDTMYWKPNDIFDVPCPFCGSIVEFFKDDPKRKCPACKKEISNPKIKRGCAEWCQHAKECIG